MRTETNFNKRVQSVSRKHRAMANGYTSELRSDGLIVAKPRRMPRRGFPFQTLILLVVGLFLFKAVIFTALGEITYNERVAKMSNGTQLEQVGAFAMQIDPATAFIAGFLSHFK